jgi:hypothetical protein
MPSNTRSRAAREVGLSIILAARKRLMVKLGLKSDQDTSSPDILKWTPDFGPAA